MSYIMLIEVVLSWRQFALCCWYIQVVLSWRHCLPYVVNFYIVLSWYSGVLYLDNTFEFKINLLVLRSTHIVLVPVCVIIETVQVLCCFYLMLTQVVL